MMNQKLVSTKSTGSTVWRRKTLLEGGSPIDLGANTSFGCHAGTLVQLLVDGGHPDAGGVLQYTQVALILCTDDNGVCKRHPAQR